MVVSTATGAQASGSMPLMVEQNINNFFLSFSVKAQIPVQCIWFEGDSFIAIRPSEEDVKLNGLLGAFP